VKPSPVWAVPLAAGIVIGWGAANFGGPPARADPTVPAALNPQESALGANLYMQTSAEYRACCTGVYQSAGDRLAAVLPRVPPEPLKPAVVLDLDETVFDNSRFQTFLDREQLPYKDAYWDLWEEKYPKEVGLVPGARAFIERAEKLGVACVYISNRLEKFRPSTIAALAQNGLSTDDLGARLFLSPDGTSDKSARREQVASRYRVLMYFGDNLRDFSEWFAAPPGLKPDDSEGRSRAIRERFRKVDEAAGHWGVDWFVLPNPVYGEWTKLLGSNPRLQLKATTMKLPEK
jgi:acid phosphatase